MGDGRQPNSARYGARLRHATTRELYRYWDGLRGTRPAPDRPEIEPADIGTILSDTFILEVMEDGRYPYRLAGSRICAAMGRELKGEDWLGVWTPRDRQALATLLRSVRSEGAGACMEFDGRNPRGQYLPFETVLLPLKHLGAGFARILGATAALDDPYWLHAQPIVELNITSLHLIWPDDTALPLQPDITSPPRLPRPLPLRRLRHLALYDGGRPD